MWPSVLDLRVTVLLSEYTLVVVGVSICQGWVRLLRFPHGSCRSENRLQGQKKKTFTPANGPCFMYRHGRGRNNNVHKTHCTRVLHERKKDSDGRGNRHSRAVQFVVCDQPLAAINYAFAYYTNVYTGIIKCIYTCRHMHLRMCVCVCDAKMYTQRGI